MNFFEEKETDQEIEERKQKNIRNRRKRRE